MKLPASGTGYTQDAQAPADERRTCDKAAPDSAGPGDYLHSAFIGVAWCAVLFGVAVLLTRCAGVGS